MAQIFVFGRVMNDLVPKESQSKQSYVCFDLMERTKNWTQFYQVWAWDADVTRLMQFKVKKGSMIWLAGSQRLVDVRMKDGKLEKKLKVSLMTLVSSPNSPPQRTDRRMTRTLLRNPHRLPQRYWTVTVNPCRSSLLRRPRGTVSSFSE